MKFLRLYSNRLNNCKFPLRSNEYVPILCYNKVWVHTFIPKFGNIEKFSSFYLKSREQNLSNKEYKDKITEYNNNTDKLNKYEKLLNTEYKSTGFLKHHENLNIIILPLRFIYFTDILNFTSSIFTNLREYITLLARMSFQAIRPLLAFSVLGEAVKIALALITGSSIAFIFSFILAFEVFYFFLQCFISFVFLSMFFKAIV
ncbi:uncharacterized protein CMU_009020 [Cryptosporidium muris RN66]|uniref:Uncharacterized protein n=1 Tax=Cryptosporidium muris (strain RN66) TaxID=441375 RepID=B6ADW9_CRYMR|nr:uncharacterized protein CMU_009020 [Cryptosporidium muris RN66]EEA06410.1 hypothetical protein, conserved [Cryptosporidium muris RN66]|eukprot:XP_002140759.1 hypothetical protein [Cryptosporidium muris RN66]